MAVFCVDLFVLFCYENLEITVCFPFVLVELDFCHLLAEYCLTDDCSEETVTDVLIFFVEIHESSEEYREIDNVKE